MEADLQGLRKILGELALQRTDLEIQIEELNKELDLLKREHEEVRQNAEAALGLTEEEEGRVLVVLVGAVMGKTTHSHASSSFISEGCYTLSDLEQ